MDTASTASVSDDVQEMESVLARLIEQIDDIREQMKADDAAIAQLKAESAALKAESQALREETQSILANVERVLGYA